LSVTTVTWDEALEFAAYLYERTVPSELGEHFLKDGMRVEVPGRWAGGGAVAVGADEFGAVADWQLYALMAVENPATGLPLHGAGGGSAVAVDATFSVPTSSGRSTAP
jgi:hypothetical protein